MKVTKVSLAKAFVLILFAAVVVAVVYPMAEGLGIIGSGKTYEIYQYEEQQMQQVKKRLPYLDEPFKGTISEIYSMLTDTLTDVEEGRILQIVAHAKRDENLDSLVYTLNELTLLELISKKWDEEYLTYNEPGFFKRNWAKVRQTALRSRPQDDHEKNDFADALFTYKHLKKSTGVLIFRSIYGFRVRDYASIDIQMRMAVLVNEHLEELSQDTKELAKEVFEKSRGTDSQASMVNLARKALGVK